MKLPKTLRSFPIKKREEISKKISKSLIGNKYRLGSKATDETKLKLSITHKGIKKSA